MMDEPTTKKRPKAFIGSSSEALDLANAVQENLCTDADVTVWSQGVFSLGDVVIDSLKKAVDDNDFGIFIFSPDDLTQIREDTSRSVRDNVLFELGLFIGRRGRRRCFFIIPGDIPDFRLASDLAGINTAKYVSSFAKTAPVPALGPACNQIKSV